MRRVESLDETEEGSYLNPSDRADTECTVLIGVELGPLEEGLGPTATGVVLRRRPVEAVGKVIGATVLEASDSGLRRISCRIPGVVWVGTIIGAVTCTVRTKV